MPNSCTIQRRHNLWIKQNQLRQAERRHSHNKQIPRRNDQRQSQRKSNNNNQSNMHNFTQRDYDFDALEQQLLQKQFADELMEN